MPVQAEVSCWPEALLPPAEHGGERAGSEALVPQSAWPSRWESPLLCLFLQGAAQAVLVGAAVSFALRPTSFPRGCGKGLSSGAMIGASCLQGLCPSAHVGGGAEGGPVGAGSAGRPGPAGCMLRLSPAVTPGVRSYFVQARGKKEWLIEAEELLRALAPIGAVLQASAHPGVCHPPHFHIPAEGLAVGEPALHAEASGA